MNTEKLVVSVDTLLWVMGIIVTIITTETIVTTRIIKWKEKRGATKKEIDSVKSALKSLLYDRLVQIHRYHMGNGFIPVHELRNAVELNEQYRMLGGNGTTKSLMGDLSSLPAEKAYKERKKE